VCRIVAAVNRVSASSKSRNRRILIADPASAADEHANM
jgi:hypothetical protein